MNVANVILYQLGGGRFVSAVDASDLCAEDDGLLFRLSNAVVKITSVRDGLFNVSFRDHVTGAPLAMYERVSVNRMCEIFRLG
jgi:hypothetical protein